MKVSYSHNNYQLNEAWGFMSGNKKPRLNFYVGYKKLDERYKKLNAKR